MTGHEGPDREYRYGFTLSLSSELDGLGVQCHVLAALHLGNRPGTHCTGGRLGPTASLDGCGKSLPHQDTILRPSSP
jgi:hypothetical protein